MAERVVETNTQTDNASQLRNFGFDDSAVGDREKDVEVLRETYEKSPSLHWQCPQVRAGLDFGDEELSLQPFDSEQQEEMFGKENHEFANDESKPNLEATAIWISCAPPDKSPIVASTNKNNSVRPLKASSDSDQNTCKVSPFKDIYLHGMRLCLVVLIVLLIGTYKKIDTENYMTSFGNTYKVLSSSVQGNYSRFKVKISDQKKPVERTEQKERIYNINTEDLAAEKHL